MRRWSRFWQWVQKSPRPQVRNYRPWAESLEARRLLAAPVVDPIGNQTIPIGKSLFVPVTGSDADNDALTYTATSSSPQVTVQVRPRSSFLRMTVANFGDLVFQLYGDLTPRTVSLISGFVKSKFYDNLTFHRIVRGFVIQGGDPQGDGRGGPGFQFEDEFNVGSIFSGNGQLAMANSGKDTNGSQFFVTIGPQRFLDHNHSIFGQLVRGFDVLGRIADVQTGQNDRPTTPVVISRAVLFTNNTDTVLSISAAAGAGPATITVTANDGSGGTATQTFQVTPQNDATNDPPILGPIANQITPANTPLSFNLTGTDPENDPLEFRANILDANPRATVTVTGNRVTVTPNAGFTGAIRLSVGVKQQGATSRGSSGDPFDTQEIIVAVGDQTVTPQGVAATATEGTAANNVTLATFTSSNAAALASDFTARINWGDSQQSDGSITKTGNTFTVTGTNTFKNGGRYAPRVTITTPLGNTIFADTTVTVADAALAGQAATTLRTRQNVALTNALVATFTDGNPNARAGDFTAVIDWGDGENTPGTIAAGQSGGFSVQGSHTYRVTGDRSVRITINQVVNNDDVTFNSATATTPASIKDSPTSQRIVTQIFIDILERPVDPQGLTVWTGRLDQGATRDQVLVEIQGSLEYRRLAVGKLYRKFLNRAADEGGLTLFATVVGSGGTLDQVQAELVASNEYFSSRGGNSNDTFLDTAFRDGLGRGIDDASRTSFKNMLTSGSTRRQVLDIIFSSAEHRQVVVRNYFQQLLRRGTDPGGLDYFSEIALGGRDSQGRLRARQEQVVAGICGSDEFLDNVRP